MKKIQSPKRKACWLESRRAQRCMPQKCSPNDRRMHTSAIGGAVAASAGAAFLCYVTPAEHLALPNLEDVKQGIMASKIAAHAADIAKGVRGARQADDRMAQARRNLDWEAQWECAMDPETAKRIWNERKPEHEDTCSMCGKFCAVRSMNKALAGEHIDIL